MKEIKGEVCRNRIADHTATVVSMIFFSLYN